ncbi:MAG: DnaJ domain-containing protein [Methanomicrobium sp.]|nr:DnaJ domain-containing protein [Methanomicrobium sp.]MDD4299799.1 DnaJ domain-containing protein [Methanomicrobium sp.]
MPSKENNPDYYDILGIDFDADFNTVKKAYRSLARAFHPDTSIHPNAVERFRIITEAYGVLSDDDKRREYDEEYEKYRDYEAGDFFKQSSDSDTGADEFSVMADYEFYSDEPENFLINGEKKVFENARHIIVRDTEYIIDGDEMINIGGIHRFYYDGPEKYLIEGEEYRVCNAEHYYQGGCEYVIINNRPYKIKGF